MTLRGEGGVALGLVILATAIVAAAFLYGRATPRYAVVTDPIHGR